MNDSDPVNHKLCDAKMEGLENTIEGICNLFGSRFEDLYKSIKLAAGQLEDRLSRSEFVIAQQQTGEEMRLMRKDIRELLESKQILEGKASVTTANLAVILGLLSLVIASAGILLMIFHALR